MAVHPTSVKNTFFRHLVFWILFIPVLTLIMVPVFQPNQPIDPAEVRRVRDLGVQTDLVHAKTRQSFDQMFVRTNIMQATENFFSGKNHMNYRDKNGELSANWIRGVWMMIFRAVWRIYALTRVFFVPVLIFSVPALIDGLAIRARKNFSFEHESPGKFYSSTHLLMLAIGMFFCIPFLPILMTANILGVLLISMTVSVWVSAANFR